MTRRRHRAVIVGLGAAGTFAARALAQIDGVECVGGVDPLGPAAPGCDGAFPVFRSVRDLAGHGEFDLAIVSVPTPMHKQACTELLENDVASEIWCEKPLASRLTDADNLTHSAARAGTELRILLHTAFASEVLWVDRELPALVDRHGSPVATSSAFNDAYLKHLDLRTKSLANSWLDSGINALSVLARFLGLGEVIDAAGRLPLQGQARVRFTHHGHEGIASLSTSWDTEDSHKTTTVTFEDGWSLMLNHSEESAFVLDASSARREKHCFGRKPLEVRYRTMLEAYFTQSRLMFDDEQVSVMHECLFEAQELMKANHSE
jgi:predicted dehydrogenase